MTLTRGPRRRRTLHADLIFSAGGAHSEGCGRVLQFEVIAPDAAPYPNRDSKCVMSLLMVDCDMVL